MAEPRPRVGVFIARYTFGASAQPANIARVLASRGLGVDVFLYRAGRKNLVSFDDPLIEVHDLDEADPQRGRLATATFVRLGRLGQRLGIRVRPEEEHVVGRRAIARAYGIAQERRYAAFIGIESGGLILAGLLGRQLGVPIVYHSLELYLSDNPYTSDPITKRLERRHHADAVATIVQDAERAELLLADNGASGGELFLVPVGMLGPPLRERTTVLRDRLGIDSDKRLVLQFGRIHAAQLSPELVRGAQGLSPDRVLVLHGSASEHEIEELRAQDPQGRVLFSNLLLPMDELPDLVASADVGLALYLADHANTTLIGSSSEKLARYLQAGLPVVATNVPSLQRVVDDFGCGVLVSDLRDLNAALDEVFSRYEEMRDAAFRCFEARYEFERQFAPVADYVEGLA